MAGWFSFQSVLPIISSYNRSHLLAESGWINYCKYFILFITFLDRLLTIANRLLHWSATQSKAHAPTVCVAHFSQPFLSVVNFCSFVDCFVYYL